MAQTEFSLAEFAKLTDDEKRGLYQIACKGTSEEFKSYCNLVGLQISKEKVLGAMAYFRYESDNHDDCKVNADKDSVWSELSDTSNATRLGIDSSINSRNMSYNNYNNYINCNLNGITYGFTPFPPTMNFEMTNSAQMQFSSRGHHGANSGINIKVGYPNSNHAGRSSRQSRDAAGSHYVDMDDNINYEHEYDSDELDSDESKTEWIEHENFSYRNKVNTSITRMDINRPMIMAMFQRHLKMRQKHHVKKNHTRVVIVYFSEKQLAKNDLNSNSLKPKLETIDESLENKQNKQEEKEEKNNSQVNAMSGGNINNYRNSNRVRLLVRIFSIELYYRGKDKKNILSIHGPLYNINLRQYKCVKYFELSNVSINYFINVAKETMNDHGTYEFFFNNCRHYAGNLIDDALSNNNSISKPNINTTATSKKKTEIKCVTNKKDCDILSRYIDHYFLNNYGSTKNDIVSEIENSFYFPIAYDKVLQIRDYGYKLVVEGVVGAGALNKKSKTLGVWRSRYCVLKMDQKLYTYKTRKCIKSTEIIDIKKARITDAEKIDSTGGSSKDSSCKFYIDNRQFEAESPKQKKEWIKILRQYSSGRSLSHLKPITTKLED